MASALDVEAYLQRIAYQGSQEPTLATLRDLHAAHLRTVPFENLDIALGRPIVLDPAALFSKIVDRRRGGYCYELNGLFALLLRALGFRVDMLAARVAKKAGGYGPDFDHLTLRVRLGKDYLADVGFGELFLMPLHLGTQEVQPDGGRSFRLTQEGRDRALWMQKYEAGWTPQYAFALTPRRLRDFEEMNRWQQTSPESHFTQNDICSRVTADGRITLSGSRLILTAGRDRRERALTDAEREAVLRDSFGIVL